MVEPEKNHRRICALIPAYNENATVGAVVTGALPYVDTVVVIDDGSRDNTAEVAERHGATVIRQGVNQGIGPALQAGYDFALREGYDLVIQLDGDGQHDPKYIPEMMHGMNGCQVVIGSRFFTRRGSEVQVPHRPPFPSQPFSLARGIASKPCASGHRLGKTVFEVD
jgi:glycosyltransferase involved in cell wall biosynthesis